MSKQATTAKPPHSLELRAKKMKMPTTPGVHVASASSNKESSSDSGKAPAEGGDSEVSPRLREIQGACNKVPLDDENAWTKTKGPKVSSLETILGYQITEAERDAAWAL